MIKTGVSTMQEVAPYALGTTALSNLMWLDLLQPVYQYTIAGLGVVVILLTIRNKWLEIRIKQNILKDKE